MNTLHLPPEPRAADISAGATRPCPVTEVVLTGRLGEFRTALRQEIEAVRRQAESLAGGLAHGRRIGLVGGRVHYAFEAENALNLPADAPADLLLPDREPLAVSVVAVEGMAVVLSVPEDLGPFIPCARLHSDLTVLLRKLIDRIETKADTPNVAGDKLLDTDVHGSPSRVDEKPYGLNTEQNRALAAGLGFDATFIQGAPGTGKSKTIGAIATVLLRSNRSVLIVSHTNAAADDALLEMNGYLADEERRQDLVIRVGDPRDIRLKEQHRDLLLCTCAERRSKMLADRRTGLQRAMEQCTERGERLCKQIELHEWVRLAPTDMEQMGSELDGLRGYDAEIARLQAVLHGLESETPYYEKARTDLEQIEKNTLRLGQIAESIAAVNSEVAQGMKAVEQTDAELSQAKALLVDACNVSWLTRRRQGLPKPKEQVERIRSLGTAVEEQLLALEKDKARLRTLEEEQGVLAGETRHFQLCYWCEPAELLQRVHSYDTQVRETTAKIEGLRGEQRSRTARLEDFLRIRMDALARLGLAQDGADSIGGMLARMEDAYRRAVDMTRDEQPDALICDREAVHSQISTIEAQLLAVEEDLKRVEQLVIEDARVVATTVTGACLRDSIQGRTFDTIIIDEASMASIPALWVAASAATSSVVVVGDPMQLPPGALSTQELAQKWLGTDLFEAVGTCRGRPAFVQFTEQYRMHPDISAVVNALVYEGELTDAAAVQEDGDPEWYNPAWRYDGHLLLVDTGSLNGWATSVSHHHGSGRLNFLSAAACVEIAGQMLRDHRERAGVENEPRILIVSLCPAQARLLQTMIEEQKLSTEVKAGTPQSFQAFQADVVILDLVEDEPQEKVAMFTAEHDRDMKRLVSMAMTRARRRLLVAGDFAYVKKKGRKAFVGDTLIPFLEERCKKVSALDVVMSGPAAKAARASTSGSAGELAPLDARIVVTEEEFDSRLREDIARAQQRVILCSPLIRQNRLSLIEPQLKDAVGRGARVYVVTKPPSDRGKREVESCRSLEKKLEEWGVVLIHKQRMHEKLVFIDDIVLWAGSFNPLSYGNTEEHMERWVGRAVVEECEKALRLQELLLGYADGSPVCPVCRSEIVACEGDEEPYFWRCVRDHCYVREVDQPGLEDGVIVCPCCGSAVEYGEWGGKPAWRCTKDRHHYLKLAKSHLRLPRMRAMMPRGELRRAREYLHPHPPSESRDPTRVAPKPYVPARAKLWKRL